MYLILISLITGYIGYTWGLGKAYNLENILGFVGFLSPTLFLVQRIYMKLQNLEEVEGGEQIEQAECPNCGRTHDTDYPKCPFCKYNYYDE